MAIWYPRAGSFDKYLQTNSYVRDINGQIKTSGKAIESKISEGTKQIVASNEELTQIFSSNFDSMNNTLELGFNRLSSNLNNINASIDSLHSDFNYSMGLILEELSVNNKLLSNLIDKLDAIHKTLQNPTLVQAREFFRIGCERLSKGLLDKALESFINAAEKNDADFFTQFKIGNLYLYGIDIDVNIINLEKAKKHLLFAARYAKAEIAVDSSFAKLAAEALFHASISVYAQLGEKNNIENSVKINELLQEAKRFATEAIELNPQLFEAFFHLAKYLALLNDSKSAIPILEKLIVADRNYAIKVDIDHAFDPIRKDVFLLLSKLKDFKKIKCENKIAEANKLLEEASEWHLEESCKLNSEFRKCKENLQEVQKHYSYQTYFGFLDATPLANISIENARSIKANRIKELELQFEKINMNVISQKKSVLGYNKDWYTDQIRKDVDESNNLILQAQSQLKQMSYNSFKTGILIAQKAYEKINDCKIILDKKKDENNRIKDKEKTKRKEEVRLKEEKEIKRIYMFGAIFIIFIAILIYFFMHPELYSHAKKV